MQHQAPQTMMKMFSVCAYADLMFCLTHYGSLVEDPLMSQR